MSERKYKNKFERELIEKVSKRLDIEEKHLYVIYYAMMEALKLEMKQPLLQVIKLPVLGSFKFCHIKSKIILRKLERRKNFLFSKIIDGAYLFKYDIYVNLKYLLNKRAGIVQKKKIEYKLNKYKQLNNER